MIHVNLLNGHNAGPQIRALILTPINPSRASRRHTDALLLAEQDIQAELHRIRRFVVENTQRICPLIRFKVECRPAKNPQLQAFLAQTAGSSAYRALGGASTVCTPPARTELLAAGISYLVILSDHDHSSPGWHPGRDSGSVRLHIPSRMEASAMLDLATDFALYHSFSLLDRTKNTADRMLIAQAAAAYAASQDLASRHGAIHGNIGYFNLASTVPRDRTWTEAELHAVNRLWTRFVDYLVAATANGTLPLQLPDLNKPRAEQLHHYIRDAHHRFGQISPSRLAKAISMLKDERYIFAMYVRRPRSSDALARIEAIFGRRCRLNTWKFFPLDEDRIQALRSVTPYVSMLYIPRVGV